ncbi:MAG: hypothetical protein OJF52_001874 [Nitrospira sp.]|nr:MAG: hypothetical protein OJF52_001874 [Nitrospira sp.]
MKVSAGLLDSPGLSAVSLRQDLSRQPIHPHSRGEQVNSTAQIEQLF